MKNRLLVVLCVFLVLIMGLLTNMSLHLQGYVPLTDKWDETAKWNPIIEQAAKEYRLDANYLAAILVMESGGQEDAISYVGAVGLMQRLPNTKPDFLSQEDLLVPEKNIHSAANLLRTWLKEHPFKTIKDAVKAYGPTYYSEQYITHIQNIVDAHR